MKRRELPDSIEWSLRKVTILCSIAFVVALVFFVIMVVARAFENKGIWFYLGVLILINLCWLLLHGTIIFLITVVIPSSEARDMPVEGTEMQTEMQMELAAIVPSEQTLQDPFQLQSPTTPSPKWNQVMLHGMNQQWIRNKASSTSVNRLALPGSLGRAFRLSDELSTQSNRASSDIELSSSGQGRGP
jgi:hypothetical protein